MGKKRKGKKIKVSLLSPGTYRASFERVEVQGDKVILKEIRIV